MKNLRKYVSAIYRQNYNLHFQPSIASEDASNSEETAKLIETTEETETIDTKNTTDSPLIDLRKRSKSPKSPKSPFPPSNRPSANWGFGPEPREEEFYDTDPGLESRRGHQGNNKNH